MTSPIARLGDMSNHGGVITTASTTVTADGKGVARAGDMHSCPIPGHGVTPMSSASTWTIDGGRGVVRVGVATDCAGCGAVMSEGSPTVSAG